VGRGAGRLVVGLDARLYPGNHTGIGVYTRGLVDGLAALPEDLELVLYTHRPFPPPTASSRVVALPCRTRAVWTQFVLPPALPGRGLSLFHATANHEAPLAATLPLVVTVHDLIPLSHPEAVSPRHRLFFGTLIGPALRRARRIIAVSRWVRRTLLERFDLPEEKVQVVAEGWDPLFAAPVSTGRVEELRRRWGIRGRVVLYVGSFEPRKNIPTLLRAFGAARRAAGEDWRLVLGGGGGWGEERTKEAVARCGAEAGIVLTGFVPPEDLPALYRMADLFVLPSLEEGFGLPVVEAMAAGVPVLVSSPSALEELPGPAGSSFSLHDPDDLARQLTRYLTDESFRREKAAQAAVRARSFSWERTARETLAVYRDALGA
jgi:glycosyltransferase involved in cell wall biosynthesis